MDTFVNGYFTKEQLARGLPVKQKFTSEQILNANKFFEETKIGLRKLFDDLISQSISSKSKLDNFAHRLAKLFYGNPFYGFSDLMMVINKLQKINLELQKEKEDGVTSAADSDYPDMTPEMRIIFNNEVELFRKFYMSELKKSPLGNTLYFIENPLWVDSNMSQMIIDLLRTFEYPRMVREAMEVRDVLLGVKNVFEVEAYKSVPLDKSYYPNFSVKQRELFLEQVTIFLKFYFEDISTTKDL
ncbi:MAG: hypothetical protein ACMG57_05720 [Candidatus Dojkabacteria bacterium]